MFDVVAHLFTSLIWRPLRSALFPYTTLFRSNGGGCGRAARGGGAEDAARHPDHARAHGGADRDPGVERRLPRRLLDRKSTRLNSSHQIISYAVFCLKKKKKRTVKHHDDV